MSENESGEGARTITVEEDGVAIEKRLAPDDFDTPAVVFTIESSRDDDTYLRVTDPLPDSIDPDDVGLHPEYDSEGWRRRGGDLQFEGRLEPGAAVETVYGLRVAEIERPSALLADPRIDDLVPAGDDDVDRESFESGGVGMDADSGGHSGLSPDDGDDATDEGPSLDIDTGADADADADSDSGSGGGAADESTAGADPDEVASALDGDSDAGTDDSGGSTGDETEGADPVGGPVGGGPTGGAGGATDGPTGEGESVAAALAAELEAGRVDDATVETLNSHLAALPRSSEVRLDSVQARLSDLEAYTDALETIIDRIGTGEDPIASLSALRSDVDDVESRLADLSDRTDDLEGETDDIATAIEDVTASVEGLRSDLGAVEDRLDAMEDLPDALEEIESDVGAVQEEIAAIRRDLNDDLYPLQEDVEDLTAWRETIAATLAGGTEED